MVAVAGALNSPRWDCQLPDFLAFLDGLLNRLQHRYLRACLALWDLLRPKGSGGLLKPGGAIHALTSFNIY